MSRRPDPAEQEERLRRVFHWLNNAAEMGQPCPRNVDLAQRIGMTSGGHGAYYVSLLERQGKIEVKRGINSRVVIIVSTGKRTAGEILKEHWRQRPVTAPIAPRPRTRAPKNYQSADTYLSDEAVRQRADKVAAEEAFITSITVSRDPCPRCGVRGDIAHTHRSRA